MSNQPDFVDEMKRAFDVNGCTGLTIWLDHNKHIQVSMRSHDKTESWACHTNEDFISALDAALEQWGRVNGDVRKPRKPVDIKKRRREMEDLI